jgi:uncharacterized membrane protein HdeD (DUF308 family)
MTESRGGVDARQSTGGGWLILVAGLLSVVAGVIILFKPSESLATLAVIAGIFLLLDGILELADALLRGTQNRGLVAVLGVLSAVAGVLLIRHPGGGVAAVALLIGIWLIAAGIVRYVAAFEAETYIGWHALAGLIELLAGIVIVADPNIGFATLALFVGIAFILNGMGMLALGWNLHTLGSGAATP